MTNKFQKSVLERLEQEKHRAASAKHSQQPQLKKIEPDLSSADLCKQPQQTVLAQVFQTEPDLREFIRPTSTRSAKNKTVYLDTEVINALHLAAQKQQVTDSKLCNDILRRILRLT